MKQLDKYRVRLLLVCLIIVMVLGGGRAKADYTFGTPTQLPSPLNAPYDIDTTPCISSDGLALYFNSWREGALLNPDGDRSEDIWVATRPTTEDEWSDPVNLGEPVNSTYNDWGPSISADGLTLYFNSQAGRGGPGGYDLWMSTRVTKDDAWGEPENLGPTINSGGNDIAPCISPDGLELFFCSNRYGMYGWCDMWVTRRATQNDPWSEPVNLGRQINGSHGDGFPSISADGLMLFFSSGFPLGVWKPRPGGFGGCDLWMTRRASKDEFWGEPVNLGPIVNTANDEFTPCISSDGSMLYFSRMTPGTNWNNLDLWQVSIEPVCDLNNDLKVDSADMHLMVDHWGEDYTLCDIGPTPLGDGIVDIQDLIVLAEHLFEDYRFIAHWKLDEKEGDIAYDSVGGHDGILYGEPIWQPASGKYAGALELDGIDDHISTPFVLNPGKDSLSAFGWIISGAPGQVIISQTGDFGETWISIDFSGKLMTKFSGIYFGDLVSETVVTDGQWHHVGLVYDMDKLHRLLYVDGVMVAEDTTVVAGMVSDGGLHIGASKDLDAGTFFSGLIDEVRIYNKALSAEEIAALAQ